MLEPHSTLLPPLARVLVCLLCFPAGPVVANILDPKGVARRSELETVRLLAKGDAFAPWPAAFFRPDCGEQSIHELPLEGDFDQAGGFALGLGGA